MKNMTNAEMVKMITEMQNTMNILLAQIEENNKTTMTTTKKRSAKKSAPKNTTKKSAEKKVEKPTRADALTQKYGNIDARKQFVEMTKVIAAEWREQYKATGKLVVEKKNYKKELYAEANRRLGRA